LARWPGVSLLVREAGRPLSIGTFACQASVVGRRGEDSRGEATVRGLVPPPLLIDMLAAGSWQHPGDAVMREIIPWFEDPLVFLTSLEHMRWESRSLDMFAGDHRSSELFREVRGSVAGPADLPWLDVERAFLVAVNRLPGDDVAIALDYRGDPSDPRVVASDFWTDPHQCAWRIVAPTLGTFAEALGLLGEQPVAGFPAGEPDGPVVLRVASGYWLDRPSELRISGMPR
jgi:hypothetical protein